MFVLFLQHIVIYMRAEAVFLFLPLMFFISTVECVSARAYTHVVCYTQD